MDDRTVRARFKNNKTAHEKMSKSFILLTYLNMKKGFLQTFNML